MRVCFALVSYSHSYASILFNLQVTPATATPQAKYKPGSGQILRLTLWIASRKLKVWPNRPVANLAHLPAFYSLHMWVQVRGIDYQEQHIFSLRIFLSRVNWKLLCHCLLSWQILCSRSDILTCWSLSIKYWKIQPIDRAGWTDFQLQIKSGNGIRVWSFISKKSPTRPKFLSNQNWGCRPKFSQSGFGLGGGGESLTRLKFLFKVQPLLQSLN